MDDKAYTCFYCHSILPYDVCISGTHFCLQATNAIEFWGNVVKIASTNSVEEPDPPEGFNEDDQNSEHRTTFKQECQDDDNSHENLPADGEEAGSGFPEMECEDEDSGTRQQQPHPIKSAEDPVADSQDGESDGVKPMNWRLKMIALVKQRPPLYDKRLPLTERTFPIRAKLWKEVYDGLNGLVPIDLLPKRFKVLRDRYNKEVKRRRLGHPPKKPWSLFKYLDFLSHSKKKVCVKKMSLGGAESRPEDCSDEKLSERLSMGEAAASSLDDESYKENLEIKTKFVQLVGERPPLYDCRLPRSVRVAENKVKLWREVFQSLGGAIPLVDLPRKFKSLRDRYMKEKKKTEAGEGASLWPLMQHMSYLDDVAFIRSSQDSPLAPATPAVVNSPTKPLDEKKCVEGLSLGGSGDHYDVEETMEVLHEESKASAQPRSNDSNIIVPDNLEKYKECCKGLLVSNERPGGVDIKEDVPGGEHLALTVAPATSGSFSPAPASLQKGKGTEGLSGKLKKLDLIDRLDSWTEDDFFGAYLVKLMKKLPLEERLRLHIDIINMITASLKSCEKAPAPS